MRTNIVVLLALFGLVIFTSCNNPEIEVSSDIVYAVPSYYVEHLKEKERLINETILTVKGDYSSFIFFTDAHWGDNAKHSPSLINHLVHNTPIKDVFFGGDVITTRFEDPKDGIELIDSFRESFDTIKCDMYYLYGNHDNNSDHFPDDIQRHIPEEMVFESLQTNMPGCIYGNHYNFYLDRNASKTRYICLDTGRYFYPQLRNNTLETVQFLIDSLNSTDDQWRIIVISHLWCDLDYNTPRETYLSDYIKDYLKILDSYNTNTIGHFSYNNESLAYDFTDSTSKIICCIGGHCHVDTIHYSESGIPIIITTTDSMQTINNENAEIGTKNEQAITAFICDYENSMIIMYRIGRGNDCYVPIDKIIM